MAPNRWPVWLRLAIVMYTGWPILSAAGLAIAVGWLTWNWKNGLRTAGTALACLLLATIIATDNSEGRCTGYVTYVVYKLEAAADGGFQYLRWAPVLAGFRKERAEFALSHMCFTLADWRAAR
jgi:hypothetical protein